MEQYSFSYRAFGSPWTYSLTDRAVQLLPSGPVTGIAAGSVSVTTRAAMA